MNEFGILKTISDDTLIRTGKGQIIGAIVFSHTSGKMIMVDGLTAYNETADKATATLTFSGVVSDGEKVIIGDEVYEFDTDDTVTAGAKKVDVSGGATAPDAVTALVFAINSEVGGSLLVDAVDGDGDTVVISAKTAGVVGNSIAVSTNCANGSFGEAVVALSGGLDANKKIGDTYTFPSGSSTIKFPVPLTFNTGLYVDLDGSTATLGIIYREN